MTLRIIDLGTGQEREPTPEETADWEAQQEIANRPDTNKQITEAPTDLFGGPTLKDIFDGN